MRWHWHKYTVVLSAYMRHVVILPVFFLLICTLLRADTIYLKDGHERKGVVVEDYHDRIVLSTEGGEVSIARDSIVQIGYDHAEENLAKLGEQYKDKGDYRTALYYYEAAAKLNPDFKVAREGALFVSNLLYSEHESDLEMQVQLRQDTEEKMGRVLDEDLHVPDLSEKRERIYKGLGLSLDMVDQSFRVVRVVRRSSAERAGLRPGDRIVSVWGKLITYMRPGDAYRLFLDENMKEVRMVFARDCAIPLRKKRFLRGTGYVLGGRLTMELEGLTVGHTEPAGPLAKAGLVQADRITEIAGSSTRYMPLTSVYNIIGQKSGNPVAVEIEREISLWRK